MKMLTKLKSFVVLLFVCTFLAATSLSSCENKGAAAGEEHPAGEEEHPKEEKKADHPKSEEHPKSESDTTKVEEQ